MTWKNSGVTWIGKVPPPPAICSTRKMIAIAFPGFPNNDTKVYTIEINTSDENTDIAINHTTDSTCAFSITISPIDTMSAWIIPNV